MTITMTDDMEVLHNLKNSPEFRCRTLPQYFILMEINDVYGTGAFELELIDRYNIMATDSEGRNLISAGTFIPNLWRRRRWIENLVLYLAGGSSLVWLLANSLTFEW